MTTHIDTTPPVRTADDNRAEDTVGNDNLSVETAPRTVGRRDELYRTPLADIAGFQFDRHVVDVFPDMLQRSIPGYRSIIAQSGLLAARFAKPHTCCYDLGCSLGSTLLAMRHSIDTADCPDCRIVGVDNSTAMLDECQRIVDSDSGATEARDAPPPPVDLVLADIADITLEPASVVAMNFTLQFIAPAARNDLLERICNATVPGGALILSEKIKIEDATLNELYIDRYHAFKRANGYSDMEISQKRSALEDVLVPDTLDTHKARLQEAGFTQSAIWFQCFNFVSIIAIKQA